MYEVTVTTAGLQDTWYTDTHSEALRDIEELQAQHPKVSIEYTIRAAR